MKIAIIDLETTGLSAYKHEIIEIGVVTFNPDNLNTKREFSHKIKPQYPQDGDPKAYAVNGYNEEEWKDARTLEEVFNELKPQFSGALFMSYNVTFDWGFMAHAYHKLDQSEPFHYHRLDLMTMAWMHQPLNSSLSLRNTCIALGIPPEPSTHRALNGALSAFEVYKVITANKT